MRKFLYSLCWVFFILNLIMTYIHFIDGNTFLAMFNMTVASAILVVITDSFVE
jgi:hypothetical protein